ncbi:MAG: hypothetical protein KKE66_18785 [Gammaproteobacteria bacterium]|nr:hypothetical protein [Gammaproteobacteria bacterium]
MVSSEETLLDAPGAVAVLDLSGRLFGRARAMASLGAVFARVREHA